MKTWKQKFQKLLSVFTIAQMLLVFIMPTAAMASTTTLVGWTFPAAPADATADVGLMVNADKAITAFNVEHIGFTADSRTSSSSDKAADADNWDIGDYWKINFNTIGYQSLQLSSWQRSSKTGPRDFKVQYSLNNTTWFDVANGAYILPDNPTGSDNNWGNKVVALPSNVNNLSNVYIRWLVTSDHAAHSGEDISHNGTNRIDDIFITGGIIDTAPPVISSHADVYVDATSAAGAAVNYTLPTASDVVDGSLPVNCLPASGSTFAIGNTTVTCTATDSSSNTATTTFVVHVVDTAPVITLNGTTPFQVEKGTPYTELGADWTDAVDGSGVANVGGDTVDVNTLGTYGVTYNYTDTAGNPAVQVTRTVMVVDTISPNIEFVSPTPADGTTLTTDHFQVRVETDEDAAGCELTIDGSTYGMINAGNNEFYLNLADLDDGDYTYEVSCWDASENDGNSISRDISIDTAGPVVAYISPTPDNGAIINVEEFEVRVDAGDAEVCYIYVDSEEFSEEMTRDGETNEFWYGFGDFPNGTYEYYVACYDKHENQTVTDPRIITVDQTPPVLTLVGASTVSVVVGNSFTDPGATAFDNEDGDITVNIVKSGDTVNTGALGSYVIRYNVSDSAGNAATEVTRTVNVVSAPIVPVAPLTTPVVTPVVATAAVAATTTTDTPAVAGAEVATNQPAAVAQDEDAEVKGSSDKACPWWWIVALVLLATLAILGGVTRSLDADNFVRKYYYIWPPALSLIAWFAHRYLQDGLQATWLCNHYWFVMLTIAVIGEVGLAYFARNRKQQ